MAMDEDIEALDVKISQLKAQYEQYFTHILKREPERLRLEIEKIILRNSNVPITNTALKFRFSSLVAKYTAYKQYWTKMLRAMAEGLLEERIEAVLGASTGATTPVSAVPVAGEKAPPSGDDPLKTAYEEFARAREKCGEKPLSFASFQKTIEENKKKLSAERGAEELDIKVYIKDGKTRLVFAPRKA
jgi:hypothetical protein